MVSCLWDYSLSIQQILNLLMDCLREDIPKKKLLTFGHCPKGGGGVQPESKSFGVFFVRLLLDITKERWGGLNLFQNLWGSFGVVLR